MQCQISILDSSKVFWILITTVMLCYVVWLNVEINRQGGGKSWLKKGVSELQVQATAWVSSWRQDTCVAWHFNTF